MAHVEATLHPQVMQDQGGHRLPPVQRTYMLGAHEPPDVLRGAPTSEGCEWERVGVFNNHMRLRKALARLSRLDALVNSEVLFVPIMYILDTKSVMRATGSHRATARYRDDLLLYMDVVEPSITSRQRTDCRPRRTPWYLATFHRAVDSRDRRDILHRSETIKVPHGTLIVSER